MAAQMDPAGDRTRCAKKYIVIIELYRRIYKDYFINTIGRETLLEHANRVKKDLNRAQQRQIDDGVDGIEHWDISLFWAIKWRAAIEVDRDTLNHLESMKDRRNAIMHSIEFTMTADEARHFFERAEEMAVWFDNKLNPKPGYLQQLRDIKDMKLDETTEKEILKKVKAEAVTLVREDGKIKIYVGKRFRIRKSAKKEKLVFVMHEKKEGRIKKICKWFSSIGKKWEEGNCKIEHVRDTDGSIIVNIIISTTEELTADEVYRVVTRYIQQAYDDNRIVLATPVDVVLFPSEYDDDLK